jgi:hypothetical protein
MRLQHLLIKGLVNISVNPFPLPAQFLAPLSIFLVHVVCGLEHGHHLHSCCANKRGLFINHNHGHPSSVTKLKNTRFSIIHNGCFMCWWNTWVIEGLSDKEVNATKAWCLSWCQGKVHVQEQVVLLSVRTFLQGVLSQFWISYVALQKVDKH